MKESAFSNNYSNVKLSVDDFLLISFGSVIEARHYKNDFAKEIVIENEIIFAKSRMASELYITQKDDYRLQLSFSIIFTGLAVPNTFQVVLTYKLDKECNYEIDLSNIRNIIEYDDADGHHSFWKSLEG